MTMAENTLATMTAPGTIVLKRTLPGPIDRVWAYLVEPELRKKWIAAGAMDLKPGGSYEYIFDHDELSETKESVPEKYKDDCYPGMTMSGRIITVEPPKLLHMSWAEGSDEASEVKFELEELGSDVLLTLTHMKLFDKDLLVGVSAGWHAHVDIMEDNLRGNTPRPFWATHMPLEDTYRESLFGAEN